MVVETVLFQLLFVVIHGLMKHIGFYLILPIGGHGVLMVGYNILQALTHVKIGQLLFLQGTICSF